MKVIRILEYDGPEEWIRDTLQIRSLRGRTVFEWKDGQPLKSITSLILSEALDNISARFILHTEE